MSHYDDAKNAMLSIGLPEDDAENMLEDMGMGVLSEYDDEDYNLE